MVAKRQTHGAPLTLILSRCRQTVNEPGIGSQNEELSTNKNDTVEKMPLKQLARTGTVVMLQLYHRFEENKQDFRAGCDVNFIDAPKLFLNKAEALKKSSGI